ncbi:FkbM family methyltransferase [Agrobacterium cavarae]|uniref:FkbM family methyltransferase n=1 Tax=Agrobacterium cavarae TaxID=2528239 RepID=UPI003D0485BC
MNKLARSIRKKIRYILDAKTVRNSGVKLVSDGTRISPYLRDLIYREAYEDTEANVLLRSLKPGTKVLEIGTGVGFIALLAAKICGAQNVKTYEANPASEQLIRENFALNGIEPVLVMKAMTSDGRSLAFNVSDNIISSSAYELGTQSKQITVSSDAFANTLRDYDPDMIIMDVEGAEYELFLSVSQLPAKDILVELHPQIIGQDKVDEIVSHLKNAGYEISYTDRKTFHFSRGR